MLTACAARRSALLAARAALRPVVARALGTFAYVLPGEVAPRRPDLSWREADRQDAWNMEGLPSKIVSGLPAAAAEGNAQAFWDAMNAATTAKVAAASGVDGGRFARLHALRALLDERGNNPFTSEEWASLLAAPSAAENEALATPAGIRAAIRKLTADSEALAGAFGQRELDGLDSGELDLAVPLSQEAREALQLGRHRDALLAGLKLVRASELVAAAVEATAPAEARSELGNQSISGGPSLYPPTLNLSVGGRPLADPEASPLDTPFTEAEITHGNQGESYEDLTAQALAHRDRMDFLPRKRLPESLAAGAPTPDLEDTARVLEANPSLSPAQRESILQAYTDILAGHPDAFSIKAEMEAFVKPQPQWGVYDPDTVKAQDEAADAALGQGSWSKAVGGAASQASLSPASAIGEVDVNPSREKLTAKEDAAAAAALNAGALAADVENLTSRITSALEASMGLRGGRGGSSNEAQLDAVRRKLAAATGAKSSGAAPAKPNFFKRYAAGERLPGPMPPGSGHRIEDPPASPAAGGAAKGGKDAKGKKK